MSLQSFSLQWVGYNPKHHVSKIRLQGEDIFSWPQQQSMKMLIGSQSVSYIFTSFYCDVSICELYRSHEAISVRFLFYQLVFPWCFKFLTYYYLHIYPVFLSCHLRVPRASLIKRVIRVIGLRISKRLMKGINANILTCICVPTFSSLWSHFCVIQQFYMN